MGKKGYLTKSRFKVGFECPRKLTYLDDDSYLNVNEDNPFLRALAKGGFQVGALAQAMRPEGHEVKTKDKDDALRKTKELLEKDSVVIFEGAFSFGRHFMRADIVRKHGNSIELIEVKSKSVKPGETFFNQKETAILSTWKSYIADVAYQKWLLEKCMDGYNITASLLLADKSKLATVDGLNQKFFLKSNEAGRTEVIIPDKLSLKDLGDDILIQRNVDKEVQLLFDSEYLAKNVSWDEYITHLEKAYCGDVEGEPVVCGTCRRCEFRPMERELGESESGFKLCWQALVKDKSILLSKMHSFDVPSLHWRHRDSMLEEGAFELTQVTEDYLPHKERDDNDGGLSNSQRQWIYIDQKLNGAKRHLDLEGIADELRNRRYPLHFIDFETARVVVPFNKGRRPYEQIAFQFSHHTMDKDGNIEHKSQFIKADPGEFPNFEFIRALKASLDQDDGTIFRYASHENTVLNDIRDQLIVSDEPDRDKLVNFIEDITVPKKEKGKKKPPEWVPTRPMIDLCDIVKRYYLSPHMEGSASLKVVLPTILKESEYLQKKYGEPIYGGAGIKSLNFKEPVTWIKKEEDGSVRDPYQELPYVFCGIDICNSERVFEDESLKDGAAAMIAYAMMQFTQMGDPERSSIKEALLRYCELDTLAMVMLFEFWETE